MEEAKAQKTADVIDLFNGQIEAPQPSGRNWKLRAGALLGALAAAGALVWSAARHGGERSISVEPPPVAQAAAVIPTYDIGIPHPPQTISPDSNLPPDAVEAPAINARLEQINEDLRRRIDELNQQNDLLEDRLEAYEAQVSRLEARAENLQGRLDVELVSLPLRLETAIAAGALRAVVDQPVAWQMRVERRWFGSLNDEIVNLSLPGGKAVIGIEGPVEISWNGARTRLNALLPLPRVLYIGTMASRGDDSPILVRINENPGWLAGLVQVLDGETDIAELERVAAASLKDAACSNTAALGEFVTGVELLLSEMAAPVPVDVSWRDAYGNTYSRPLPAALLASES